VIIGWGTLGVLSVSAAVVQPTLERLCCHRPPRLPDHCFQTVNTARLVVRRAQHEPDAFGEAHARKQGLALAG